MQIIRRSARRRGAAAVEAAVILPLFLAFLLGIFEYARLLAAHQAMAHAAREAARYAVVHTYDKTTTDIQNVADSQMLGMTGQIIGYNKTTNISVYTADPSTGNPIDAAGNATTVANAPFTNAAFGQGIAVQISGQFRTIIPAAVRLRRRHGPSDVFDDATQGDLRHVQRSELTGHVPSRGTPCTSPRAGPAP